MQTQYRPPEEEIQGQTGVSSGEAQDGQGRSSGPLRRCQGSQTCLAQGGVENQQETHSKWQSKQNYVHHVRSELTSCCYAETHTAGTLCITTK